MKILFRIQLIILRYPKTVRTNDSRFAIFHVLYNAKISKFFDKFLFYLISSSNK